MGKGKEVTFVIDENTVIEYEKYYFKKHPKAKSTGIPSSPAHPSLNEIFRGQGYKRRDSKNKWEEFIAWVIRKEKLSDLRIGRCQIIYKTYFKDKRPRDVDNITPKFILDAFVREKLIVADDYKILYRLITEAYRDEYNPRIEFTIIED